MRPSDLPAKKRTPGLAPGVSTTENTSAGGIVRPEPLSREMTLREYYIGQIASSLALAYVPEYGLAAEMAYNMADALMAERRKRELAAAEPAI